MTAALIALHFLIFNYYGCLHICYVMHLSINVNSFEDAMVSTPQFLLVGKII
jgi:hypothetical protein